MKKKFFKQFLPLILSIALAFEALPSNVYAAEIDDVQTVTEASVTEDSDAEITDEVIADEVIVADESEESEAATQAAEETEAAVETTEVEEVAEVEEVVNDAAPVSAVIEIKDSFSDRLAAITTVPYSPKDENPLGRVISELKDNGLEVKSLDGEVLVNSKDIVSDSLEYDWFKVVDGKNVAMTDAVPVNAGDYVLEIKDAAEPKVIDAETVSINCTIEKVKLVYDVDWDEIKITNNTTVADLKAQLVEKAFFMLDGEKIDPARYVDKEKMSIIIKLANQDDDAALDDKTVIDRREGVGYVYKVTAPVNADSVENYETVEKYSPVSFKNLVASDIEISWPANADKNWLEYTYTGAAVEFKNEFSYEVTAKDEEDNKIVITPNEGEVEVYFADMDGNKMESNPVDAGAYLYVITYNDTTGVYESSKEQVDVIINPAIITVTPAISKDLLFFRGQTAATVLANVDYTVEGLLGSDSFDKNTFWGVSYGNDGVFQPFEPEFAVQQKKTDDKNAAWETIASSSVLEEGYDYRIVLTGSKIAYVDGKLIDGEINDVQKIETSITDTGVHAANANYVVNDKDLYNEKQVYDFTAQIKDKSDVTIDPTALLIYDSASRNGLALVTQEDKSEKIDPTKIYTKIYDGIGLYENRSAYKKAVLKDKDGKQLDVKSSDLTYTWFSFELKEIELNDKDGNVEYVDLNSDNILYTTVFDGMPKDAGYYKLEISYSNAAEGIVAEPVTIFYHIEKQMLKLAVSEDAIPGGEFNVYNADKSDIEELTASISENDYRLLIVPGNDLTVSASAMADSEFPYYSFENRYGDWFKVFGQYEYENSNNAYRTVEKYLAWTIYKSTTVKDYEDVDSESYNMIRYTRSNNGYEPPFYEYGMPYRARANVELSDSLDKNYEVICDSYKVNVKQMGNIGVRLETTDAVEKLTTQKVYDAANFSVSYDGLVTALTNIEDKNITSEIALDFYWTWSSDNVKHEECGSDVGTYTLYCEFKGDDTYHKVNAIKVAEFEIVKRKVTITPVSNNEIVAGMNTRSNHVLLNQDYYVNQMLDRITPFTIEMEQVEGAPVYEDYMLSTVLPKALSAAPVRAVVENNVGASNKYLRYGVTYTLKISDLSFKSEGYYSYGEQEYYWNPANYDFEYASIDFTVEKRSHSSVFKDTKLWGCALNDEAVIRLAEQKIDAEGNVVITPISGIQYFDETFLEERIDGVIVEPRTSELGNYVTVGIKAPQEFFDEFIDENNYYRYDKCIKNIHDFTFYNSIKEAGGYVYGYNNTYGIIYVAFLVNEGDKEKIFEITWEDGYTEKFLIDLTQSALLTNIFAATLPKTLAFNVANKTMVVGDSQQLDVKITKKLATDVVSLRYRVVEGTAVSVTEDGYVTAVEPGKAKIEVYPVWMDKDGNVRTFDEWKKKVIFTLNVKNVTAPQIKSTYTYDDAVTITYQKPADGYRREIYVAEGKNVKPAEFETRIAAMKQSIFEGGIYLLDAEEYVDVHTEYKDWYYDYEDDNWYSYRNNNFNKYYSYDASKKLVTVTLFGLNPAADYTVYVRNVSATRELTDGSVVVLTAAGKTKSVKTQKAQLDSIDVAYPDYIAEEKYSGNYVNLESDDFPAEITYVDANLARYTDDWEYLYDVRDKEYTIIGNWYSVSLNQKTIQLSTTGDYNLKVSNEDAEGFDRTILSLPLSKEDADVYQAPKLGYFAVSSLSYRDVKTKEYSVKIGNRFYSKSAIATVDKKGKVTLKGVGEVFIIAFDSYTGKYGFTKLTIESPFDSMTAKSVKVAVGSTFDPIQNSYLTLLDGKTKLINGAAWYKYTRYHEDNNYNYIENDGFTVTIVSGTGLVQNPNENTFYAKEPNQTVELNIASVKNPSVSVNMTVKTSAMPAVKGLKAYDVTDHTAKLRFTFNANDYENLKFDLRVTDAKNQLIKTEILDAVDFREYWYENNDSYYNSYQYSAYNTYAYIADKNTYIYKLNLEKYDRNSNYTITLTPIFDNDVIGKTVKTKMKTTNVPFSYVNHLNVKKDYLSTQDSDEEGESPSIMVQAKFDNGQNEVWCYDLSEVKYLTSNNTFTLMFNGDTSALKNGQDSISWKSTNSKVATIKTIGYGESATLKTIREGETVIECTSKVTKKVIARYKLYVKAAGDGTFTLGAYNDYDDNFIKIDPTYAKANGYLLLTEKNPVRLEKKPDTNYANIMFTAPSDGYYSIYEKNRDEYIWELWMYKGETIGFPRYYSSKDEQKIVVYGDHYERIEVGQELKGNVVFYAPTTGAYAVYTIENGIKKYRYATVLTAGDRLERSYGRTVTVGIEKIESIDNKSGKLNITDLEKGDVKYVSFTATIDGEYKFTSEETISQNVAKQYRVYSKNDDSGYTPSEEWATCDTDNEGYQYLDQSIVLNTGDIVIFKLEVSNKTTDVKITVTEPTVKELKDATKQTYENTDGATVWYKYTVDDFDSLYTISVEEGSVSTCQVLYSVGGITGDYITVDEGKYAEIYGQELDANTTKKSYDIYVKVVPQQSTEEVKLSPKATFVVTKVVPFDLSGKTNENSLTISANRAGYYTFTAPSYGVYALTATAAVSENAPNTFKVVKYDNGFAKRSTIDLSGSTNAYHSERILQKGDTICFAIKGLDAVMKEAQVKIKMQAITPTLLKEVSEDADGTKVTYAASNRNEYQYYKFVATSDGTYQIAVNSASANLAVMYSQDSYYDYTIINLATDTETGKKNGTARFEMAKGSYVIIRVQITDDLVGDGYLKITDVTNPHFVDGEQIVVSENGTRTLIIKEAGRYRVLYDLNNCKGTEVTITDTNGNSTTYGENNEGEEFIVEKVGTKYTINVSNSVSADNAAKPEVSIALVQPKDIKVNDKVSVTEVSYTGSVANQRYKWYKLIIPDSGRYKLEVTNSSEAFYDIRIYSDMLNDATSTTVATWSKQYHIQGKEYFIRAGVNAKAIEQSTGKELPQAFDFKVSRYADTTDTSIALKLGEDSEAITISENEVYFNYTATEDDYYVVKLVSGNNTNKRSLSYAKNTDSFYGAGNEQIVKLRKGDVITLKVTANAGATKEKPDRVNISKLDYKVLEVGKTVNVSVTNWAKDQNAKQYFVFKYPESGTAEFGVTAESGVVVSANAVYPSNYYPEFSELPISNCASYEGVANKDILFYAYATGKTETISFGMTVKMVEFEPVELGDKDKFEKELNLNKGQRYYYSFKPEEAGRYIISIADREATLSSVVTSYTESAYWNQLTKSDFVTTDEMIFDGKDDKVEGYVYTVSPNIATTMTFQKVTPSKKLANTGDTSVEIADKSVVWVYYEAPETGYYSFSAKKGGVSTNVAISANAAVYTKMDAATPSNNLKTETIKDRKLNAGQKLYIRLDSADLGTETAVITVTSREMNKLNATTELTVGKSVSENGVYTTTVNYAKYSVEQSGYYKVTMSSPKNLEVTVSYPYSETTISEYSWTGTREDGKEEITYTWTNNTKGVFLHAGQEITVVAENDQLKDVIITIEIEKVSTFDTIIDTQLFGQDGYNLYQAKEDGVYRFVNTTPDTTLYYQVNGTDENGYDAVSGSVSLDLKKGHFIFFKLVNDKASEANTYTSSIGVYVPKTVVSGQSKLASGNETVVKFIAPHSTDYYISLGAIANYSLTYEKDGDIKVVTEDSYESDFYATLTEGVEYTLTFSNPYATSQQYTYSVKNN